LRYFSGKHGQKQIWKTETQGKEKKEQKSVKWIANSGHVCHKPYHKGPDAGSGDYPHGQTHEQGAEQTRVRPGCPGHPSVRELEIIAAKHAKGQKNKYPGNRGDDPWLLEQASENRTGKGTDDAYG
jgi:hypothetical protein